VHVTQAFIALHLAHSAEHRARLVCRERDEGGMRTLVPQADRAFS
jgi:hypothetical protein